MELEERDRVREHTDPDVNTAVDRETIRCLETYAASDRSGIDRHVYDLEREWDIERVLETNAGIAALAGTLLGVTVNKKFLILPGVVFGFLMQHAIQGWCPPVPVFRAFGIRTRKEINRERYALKALRGDFEALSSRSQ
jgi:hypothetical protein